MFLIIQIALILVFLCLLSVLVANPGIGILKKGKDHQ